MLYYEQTAKWIVLYIDLEKIMKRYKDIIAQIAKENNTTPEEVEREMRVALNAAYRNPTPEQKRLQQTIPSRGDIPTPEEFIFALAKKMTE